MSKTGIRDLATALSASGKRITVETAAAIGLDASLFVRRDLSLRLA
jgi:hypothetical protein